MKTFLSFLLIFVLIALGPDAAAQDQKQTFNVAGVCGMCKKKIETAARAAGAEAAVWNTTTKQLLVRYSSKATTLEKIQQGIAATGYDTPSFKATEAAYESLHECCKYERAAACCGEGACTAGKNCCADKSCCAEGQCTKAAGKDCCKKA